MSNFERWQKRYQKGRKKWMLGLEKGEEKDEKKERQRRKSGRKTKEERVSEIVVSINRDKAINPKQYKRGENREILFEEALKRLKEEGEIQDFISVSGLSRPDLKGGIDFYVIRVNTGKYETYPIGVTGPRYVTKQKRKRPWRIIVPIDEKDSLSSIKEKILISLR